MNLKANGEPLAFPTGCPADRGLTKREYFAALAMQGFAADGAAGAVYTEWAAKWVAARSVEFADALIAELAKDGAA